jgi:glucose/arabinose dehydrogenase
MFNSIDSLVNIHTTTPQTIAFIDAGVYDAQSVAAGLQADIKVILDPNKDGIDQITQTLSQYRSLEAVTIISHGNSGELSLGSSLLNQGSLERYADELLQWQESLSFDADILLGSCSVAAGDVGKEFLQKLSDLTGADIAASTDLTGNAAQGGDWVLEYSTGSIEAEAPFSTSLMDSYQGVLVYLSDLAPTSTINGWGPIERDRSNGEQAAGDGGVITLNGVTYAKGLGTHANSDVTYALGGSYTRFTAEIGVDDYVGNQGSVVFEVWADGVRLFASGLMTGTSTTQSVNVDVSGRQTLQLIVTGGGDGINYDHASWGNAQLVAGTPTPDTTAPTATATLSNVTTTGATTYDFTVTYTDNRSVNVSTIDNNDVLVTGVNGFSQLATRVNVSSSTDGSPRTATYRLTAPGGAWDTTDNGTYTVALQTGQVADTSGNTVAATTLGTFQVTIGSVNTVYLSDLTPTSATNGWGPIERDRSNGEQAAGDGGVITLNGVTYAKGLGTHANSDVTYALGGSYTRFTAEIGVDDYVGNQGSVVFEVWADGVRLFASGLMTGTSTTQSVNVDVSGRQTLQLIVTGGGDGINYDHASWGNAQLALAPSGPDTNAPVAVLTAAGITNASASPYNFTVTYTDRTAVDVSSINGTSTNSDIRVTGPNGFSQLATLVGVTPSTNGSPLTATYRLNASDGIWNWSDRGTYQVTLLGGEVRDTLGNTTTTNTALGNFEVTVASSIVIGVNSSQVTEGGTVAIPIRRLGDTTGTATINYFTGGNSTAVPGVNYQSIPVTTLTFAPGEAERIVNIQTLNDGVSGTNVSTSLLIESPTGADLGPSRTSLVSIRDVAAPATTFTYLSDLTPTSATNGWGPVERDMSNGENAAGDGRRLTLNRVTYNKGLGVHADSNITYNLGGAYNSFFAYIGVDDEVNSLGTVVFQIWADGVQLFDSGVMTGDSPTRLANVDVTGRQTLRLVVTGSTDGGSYDHANWADAQLVVGQFTPPPPQSPPNSFIRESVVTGLNQPTTIEWTPDGRLMFIAQKGGEVRAYVNPNDSNNSVAQFSSVQQYATGTHAHGIDAADLNNDGNIDLVVANSEFSLAPGSVSVLFGRGDGTFNPAVNYAVGIEPKSVIAVDLNGDNNLDLATANQNSNNVTVLINNGNGTFAPAVSYAGPVGAHEVQSADIDGDGDRDLAVVGWGSTIVRVLRNNGNGTFANAVDYSVGVAPHSLQLADFNGDNRPDLAVANLGSSAVSVLRNTGNGTFAPAINYAVGAEPHSIRAADLDRDGDIDLAAVTQADNSVSVLLNSGNGSFATAVSYTTGSVPKGITIADINNDGNLDLLTANTAGNYPDSDNPGGNTITVLLGSGNGTFTRSSTHITGRTPFSLVTADFNEDGRLDVATANWHTNDVGVLINRTSSTPLPPGLAPGLQATPFIDISSQVNNVSDRGLLGLTIDPLFGRNQGRDFIYLLYTYDPPQAENGSGLAARDAIGNRPARLVRVTANPATNYTTAIPGSEVILLGNNSLWSYTSRPDVDSTDNFIVLPSGVANGIAPGGTTPDGTSILPPANLIEDPDPANLGRDYSDNDTNFENNNNIRDYLAGDSQSHSIGQVQFGPDGYLYVTIGDGTSYNGVDWRATRVQDIDNLSGKMLRIDPLTGQGVSNNPFYNGDPNSNRSKVFALGFRNTFRFAFDPITGNPYGADVGWTTWEELNEIVSGGNYGWPYYEGPTTNSGYAVLPQAQAFYSSGQVIVPPRYARHHDASQNPDGRAATAFIMGDIYSGNTFPANYNRAIFYNDVGLGMIYVSYLNSDGTIASTELFDDLLPYIVDMETGPEGDLYYVSLLDGTIGRWSPS